MNKIDKAMNWYDCLTDDCRFYAFLTLVFIPLLVLQAVFPLLGLIFGILIVVLRLKHLNRKHHAKDDK